MKKVPRAIQQKISKKIKILMDEGYPQKQAIAIAYSMVAPKYKRNPKGPWSVKERVKNSFGDLIVVFFNEETGKSIESTFSEGEHHQAEHFLNALNENVEPISHRVPAKLKKGKNLAHEINKILSGYDLMVFQTDKDKFEITTFHDPSVGLNGMILGHITPSKFIKNRKNYPLFMSELSSEEQEGFKQMLAEIALLIRSYK